MRFVHTGLGLRNQQSLPKLLKQEVCLWLPKRSSGDNTRIASAFGSQRQGDSAVHKNVFPFSFRLEDCEPSLILSPKMPRNGQNGDIRLPRSSSTGFVQQKSHAKFTDPFSHRFLGRSSRKCVQRLSSCSPLRYQLVSASYYNTGNSNLKLKLNWESKHSW